MADSGPVFAGSIPANYNRYMVPMLFEAYARGIANRIDIPNEGRVLELACGTGAVTKQLRASLANTVHIVATDLNPGMLDVAQKALGAEAAIEFKIADGTDLPFKDASFDAVVCQFGVMFFPDKFQGFTEAARVLRPGGRLYFSVWDTIDHNGFSKLVHETAISVSPEITFMSMPFSFNDVSAIKTLLESAEFCEMDFSVQPREFRADSIDNAVSGVVDGSPLGAEFEASNLMEEGRKAMKSAFRSKYGDGPVLDTMQAIVIEAAKPI